MDAAAELGRNPASKHLIQPECGDEQADGTGLPNPSRKTKFSGANGDREILIFPVQMTTNRIGNLTRLILTLVICDDHTYIHTTPLHVSVDCRDDALGRNLKQQRNTPFVCQRYLSIPFQSRCPECAACLLAVLVNNGSWCLKALSCLWSKSFAPLLESFVRLPATLTPLISSEEGVCFAW